MACICSIDFLAAGASTVVTATPSPVDFFIVFYAIDVSITESCGMGRVRRRRVTRRGRGRPIRRGKGSQLVIL